jgi:uncharacterized damage-inducible protein DinB
LSLTQSERDRAVEELLSSRNALLESVVGLTSAQWSYRPASGRWSIAECLEHVALAEDWYFELIAGKILSSPAHKIEAPCDDFGVVEIMQDRSSKRTAWQNLQPSGRWSAEQALDRFTRSRARFISFTSTTSAPLREHFEPHRAAGLIDAYRWILLASGHVRRHIDQILEIKADSSFPRIAAAPGVARAVGPPP